MNQNESMESLWNRHMGKFEQPTPPPFERISNLSTVENGIAPTREPIGPPIDHYFGEMTSTTVSKLMIAFLSPFAVVGAFWMAIYVWIPLIFG